jgi:hypothetical protein
MPTRDSIVQVPFVGGIDQHTDPDQLQPPNMARLDNCVVRKPGRIEKRAGMHLISVSGGSPWDPANSFSGLNVGLLPADAETVGANESQDGSKLLVAAGSTLFEYVGATASKGYREVNRLPSCYGTLHPVDATGGEVIETESMVNDAGTFRCTTWVIGVRNGQDLTNDKAIRQQPSTTHGIYVAVQRVSDGSFVTAPTRILDSSGVATAGVSDVRMMLSQSDTGPTRHWVVAFRRNYAVVEAFVVSSTSGVVQPTQIFSFPNPPTTTAFTGRPYWRAFDITNVPGQPYFLFAWCDNDTSPGSSDAYLRLVSFSATTGVFTIVYNLIGGVIAASGASGSTGLSVHDWQRFTPRGIVLETDPGTSTIAIGLRMVYEMDAAPFYLDGKIVTTRAACSGSTIVVTAGDFAWLHRLGFQTEDNFSTFKSGGTGQQFKYSASVSATGNYLLPTTYSTSSSTQAIVTALFFDGSTQTYSVEKIQATPAAAAYMNPAVYRGSQLNTDIVGAGVYPSPLHGYPPSNLVAVETPNTLAPANAQEATVDQRNITRAQLGGAPAVVSAVLANTIQYCRLSTGAGVKCLAVVAFDGTGTPYEVDLYDGRGAANVLGVPALATITQLETRPNPYSGAWSAPYVVPVATIEVFDDFNAVAAIGGTDYIFNDIGSNTDPVQQAVVETDIGVEQCVHRWDVKLTTGPDLLVLAVSSTSAATFSGPNGDAPLGYVSPFARSNYFEVYPWDYDNVSGYDFNDYATTGSSTARPIWCAMGGPWRMISSLVKIDPVYGRLGCVLMPSGDDYQRSAFLVSFSDGDAQVETLLDPIDNNPIQYAGGVVYSNNRGVFVESMNMARIAAAPLNCPRLTVRNPSGAVVGFTCGAIRQGQSDGGSEVFALDYTTQPSNWRTMRQWGDYTIVNGGILSAYDGSSCNEATMLLWPQRDMTSIAYPLPPTNLFATSAPAPAAIDLALSAYTLENGAGPFLANISRPWFAYEAGFRNRNAFDPFTLAYTDMFWSRITTAWGGDPTKDFQSVYADPRLLQITGSNYNTGAGVAQAGAAHYYGRFQSGYSVEITTAGSPIKVVIWAPRTAGGLTNVLNSVYNPLVANGDFLARWCYEAVDGTGRVVRSAPSQAVTFSVCAAIRFTERVFGSATLTKPDVDVDEYRYGFYVPRLELTNRLKTATADSKRTVLQPYFTAEPFATVFYRVPFTNFLPEYKNDFTISRNATRGVVPYSSANAGGVNDNPYGLVTNNFKCFDGPQGDYNGLLSQPFLYTTGGVLDNVPPPSALCMTVHQNRLVAGGADDATVVWFSKELSPTDAPGFNDALTIQIEDGGPVTGIASLESVLVIFKQNMTFIVPGDMPDDAGGAINRGYVSNTLGTPVRMPHGIGCIDHRSVVETPVGVFFQSARTIELLARDMSITPVGLKLDDSLTSLGKIVSAAHNAKDNEVWFVFQATGAEQVAWATYNYLTDTWSTHALGPWGNLVRTQAAVTMVGNTPHIMARYVAPISANSTTVVFRQSDSTFFDVGPNATNNGRLYVPMSWQTAPIAMNQIQGYQRLKRVRVIGSPIPTPSTGAPATRNAHGASFTLQTDYATAGLNIGSQTASWTEAEATAVYNDQNREVYEVHVAEQKGQKLTLSYTETAPASITGLTHGYGTAFSNLALIVGLKTGLDKRITSGAKH